MRPPPAGHEAVVKVRAAERADMVGATKEEARIRRSRMTLAALTAPLRWCSRRAPRCWCDRNRSRPRLRAGRPSVAGEARWANDTRTVDGEGIYCDDRLRPCLRRTGVRTVATRHPNPCAARAPIRPSAPDAGE